MRRCPSPEHRKQERETKRDRVASTKDLEVYTQLVHHLVIFALDKVGKPVQRKAVALKRAFKEPSNRRCCFIAALAIEFAGRRQNISDHDIDTGIKARPHPIDTRLQAP